MIVEDPCCVFMNDERYTHIEQEIDDIRLGDLESTTPELAWSDGPADFVDWLEEGNYDMSYDHVTTVLGVMCQYIDEREYDGEKFTQEDIDELLEYASTAQVKAFYPDT